MKFFKLLASILLTAMAGVLGSIATIPNIPTWYAFLHKPWFDPPNWVFGPVWTTLYILIGISFYLIWTSSSKKSKRLAYVLFGIQLVLNAAWSVVFFGLYQPWAAVVVIVFLLATIIAMLREYRYFSRKASWLLVPYIVWVSFAMCLNIAVAYLN